MNEKKPKAAEAAFSAKSGELRALAEETITEWFNEKHRARSEAEVAFVNSVVPGSCPHCGSARIRKDGFNKKTGIRVYECLDPGCGRKFGPLTGTVFDSKKIPISETIEFLYHLFQFHSSTSSAKSNMNADSTGLYRVAKLFLAAEGIQDGIAFEGKVWIDEKYVPVWKSAKARNADGDAMRGLSRNQLCICTATDGERCVVLLCGTGQPTPKKALDVYSKVISPASVLIHDGSACHRAIAAHCRRDEIHTTAETKGLPDKRNPMEPVNKVHRLLELFLKRHGGYKREDLPGWLNLFAYWYNTPGTAMEKAIKFIEMAVKKRKMLRYRAWGSKKKHDGD
jgi:transposase-like protein